MDVTHNCFTGILVQSSIESLRDVAKDPSHRDLLPAQTIQIDLEDSHNITSISDIDLDPGIALVRP